MSAHICDGCRKRAKILARGVNPGVTICDCREEPVAVEAGHPYGCNCFDCRWRRVSDFLGGG